MDEVDIKLSLKKAEELVRKSRLAQIAKEHKSIGAILDTRKLYDLVDPRKKGKPIRADDRWLNLTKRVSSPTTEQTDTALLTVYKNASLNPELTGDYGLEYEIWKSKSGQRSYSQKRRYYFPELQNFKDKMNTTQKKVYKEKVKAAIKCLADKYRQECAEMKSELDYNGVFHPDANAHRVHCMYLMKLNKGIRSESIEDPILRKMREEVLEKEQKDLEEEMRKELLIKMATSLEAGNDVKNLVDEDAKSPARVDENDTENKASNAKSNLPQLSSSKNTKIKRLRPIKKSLNTRIKTLSKKVVSNMTKSMDSIFTAKSTEEKLPIVGGKPHSPLKLTDPDYGALIGGPLIDKHQKSTDRLFQKIKRGKLGGVDARLLLEEEAVRLEKAESMVVRRSTDKSDLLDNEMTSWMLSSLQKNQISKTAGGGTILTSSGIGTLSSAAQPSQIVLDFAKSLNGSHHSPEKLMPFNEFYEMFKKFSPQKDTQLKSKNGDGLRTRILNPNQSERKSKSDVKSLQTEKVLVNRAAENLADTEDDVQVNLVKKMTEIDPKFDAYLKLASQTNQRHQDDEKDISQVIKPKRDRKVTSIGKDAIQLKDSRGKISKDASKGFSNHFQTASIVISEDDLYGGKTGKVVDHSAKNGSGAASPVDDGDHISIASYRSANSNVSSLNRSNSRRSRSRGSMEAHLNRAKSALIQDDDDLGGDPTIEYGLHEKLISVWEVLQAPNSARILFMSKYSTEAYSIEMGKAVDMWAESAVFLVTLMELIKISKKLMTGMLLDSMTEQNLLTRIHSKVPAILSSSAFSLIPPVFDYESDDALAAPLSSIAIYRTVKQIVQQAFRKKSFTNEGLTQEDCVEVMEDIIKLVIERLQHSISTIHEELDDVVPFGNKNCKEWLHIQKNKLFPMQK